MDGARASGRLEPSLTEDPASASPAPCRVLFQDEASQCAGQRAMRVHGEPEIQSRSHGKRSGSAAVLSFTQFVRQPGHRLCKAVSCSIVCLDF